MVLSDHSDDDNTSDDHIVPTHHEHLFHSVIDEHINHCNRLILNNCFEELIEFFHAHEDFLSPCTETERIQHLDSLLDTALSQANVTKEAILTILSLDTGYVSDTTQSRSALHVIINHVDRPDLVQAILETYPQWIHVVDSEGLRPIDFLTQKILMKEERLRYLGRRKTLADEQALSDTWECARLVIVEHVNTLPAHCHKRLNNTITQPLLHIVLQANDIPLALIERAIRTFQKQLSLPDYLENLPLHYIAGHLPLEDMDVLDEVLKAYPRAARHKNAAGEYPLNIAIAAQRRLRSGMDSLIRVYPDPISDIQLPNNTVPLVVAELLRKQQHDIVYCWLKGNLEAFALTSSRL